MHGLEEISAQMLSRFTQIDYDREMAFIALTRHDGAERQIAVARCASSAFAPRIPNSCS